MTFLPNSPVLRTAAAGLFFLAFGAASNSSSALFATNGPTVELRLKNINRTYSDFVVELAPIGEEGMSVLLTSPTQTLIVHDHRIRLTQLAGNAAGVFAGEVELDVQGKGLLVADVTMGPISRQLTDEVIVPPQTLRIAGRIRIRRVANGYEVTPEELPRSIEIAVQSQTINQILALCDQAATLSLGAIDCSGLGSALTRPAVPLPGAAGGGGAFLLGDEDLTDTDRAWLDIAIGTLPAARP